jgi:hypothetical protein
MRQAPKIATTAREKPDERDSHERLLLHLNGIALALIPGPGSGILSRVVPLGPAAVRHLRTARRPLAGSREFLGGSSGQAVMMALSASGCAQLPQVVVHGRERHVERLGHGSRNLQEHEGRRACPPDAHGRGVLAWQGRRTTRSCRCNVRCRSGCSQRRQQPYAACVRYPAARPRYCWRTMAKNLRAALGVDPEPRAVVAAISQIAATLADLAADGISHRDIKPDNLFMFDGNCVIGDFGLVTYPAKNPITRHGRKVGPLDFMAPEMRQDADRAVAEPADVWALAKTLWVLLADTELPLPGPHRAGDDAYALSEPE